MDFLDLFVMVPKDSTTAYKDEAPPLDHHQNNASTEQQEGIDVCHDFFCFYRSRAMIVNATANKHRQVIFPPCNCHWKGYRQPSSAVTVTATPTTTEVQPMEIDTAPSSMDFSFFSSSSSSSCPGSVIRHADDNDLFDDDLESSLEDHHHQDTTTSDDELEHDDDDVGTRRQRMKSLALRASLVGMLVAFVMATFLVGTRIGTSMASTRDSGQEHGMSPGHPFVLEVGSHQLSGAPIIRMMEATTTSSPVVEIEERADDDDWALGDAGHEE